MKTIQKSVPLLAALLGVCTSGCTPVLPAGMENHIIAADFEGSPAFFDTVDTSGKVIRKGESVSLPEHLSRMKAAMEKSGRKKIVIYCFGGMNSFEETIEASVKNTEIIMKESPDVYPLFVNWDSELFGCYCEDLFVVRQGIADYWLGPLTSPLIFSQHVLTALVRLPANLLYQSQGISDLYAKDLYAEVAEELKKHQTDVACYMGKDCSSHRWMPLARCGYVAGFPFRVLTTGLIDAFGSRGWREMRRRARLGFTKDPDLSAPVETAIKMFSTDPDGVFSRFAEMLIDYAKRNPDSEITLIGHCMGTFLVTEFLGRYPELPVRNIVFMAGASPVQETAAVVKPYLMQHPEAHFYNLCLHPWVDWYDMMNYCVLPCGSVLAWVNQHLTEPLSKEDFTVGIWDPAIAILPRMMSGVEKQMTLKAFGIEDPASCVTADGMPRQHTDFSDPAVKFWREDFWRIPGPRTAPPKDPARKEAK